MNLKRFFKHTLISLTFTLMMIVLGIFLILILPLTPVQKILVFLILLTGYFLVELNFYKTLIIRKHIQGKNQNFKRSLLNQISPVHEEEETKDQEIIKIEEKHSQAIQIKATKSKYLGSTETRKYHLSNCRFSKLIKTPYRLESNDESFFKKKKFKPCKTCIKTKKSKSKMNL